MNVGKGMNVSDVVADYIKNVNGYVEVSDSNYKAIVMREGHITVNTSIRLFNKSNGCMFAAQMPELALVSYGRNQEAAIDAVKAQFHRFCKAYKTLGLLERRLSEAGVKWGYGENDDACELV